MNIKLHEGRHDDSITQDTASAYVGCYVSPQYGASASWCPKRTRGALAGVPWAIGIVVVITVYAFTDTVDTVTVTGTVKQHGNAYANPPASALQVLGNGNQLIWSNLLLQY